MHKINLIFYTQMTENKHESIDLLLKSGWLSVSKMYSEHASLYDSTAVQALTLLKIDPKKGTRSTNLGPKMAIEPTSLSRIIKILESEGMIYKEKTDRDKREVIIKLTDKGLMYRNLSKEIVLEFNNKVLENISPENIEIFKNVVKNIVSIANDMTTKNSFYNK